MTCRRLVDGSPHVGGIGTCEGVLSGSCIREAKYCGFSQICNGVGGAYRVVSAHASGNGGTGVLKPNANVGGELKSTEIEFSAFENPLEEKKFH